MTSNKNESRNNLKNKGNCKLYGSKRSASTLNISQVKLDRSNKSKLESSTDSKLPVLNKTRKPHNCMDSNVLSAPCAFKKPPSVLKRKSISLLEFTTNTNKMRIWTPKKWESKEDVNETNIKEVVKAEFKDSSLSSNDTELAEKVYKMFILNAWRHRNSQVSSLQNKLTKMGNEVDNLNIQVVVLRNLLESEKLRVAVSMSDASHLKLRLENELKESSVLKNKLNSLEPEKNDWKTQEMKMSSEIRSLKDEVTLTSEQNKYLKRECDDLAKALSDTKQNEGNVQHQLIEVRGLLKEREENIKVIKNKCGTLVERMLEMKKINQNLAKENVNKERKIIECINKINEMDVELNNSQNTCKVQNENIKNLKEILDSLEEKVETQTKDIENLKTTVEKYESEKEESKKCFIKFRNQIIFEAIKITASLFFPYHPYL